MFVYDAQVHVWADPTPERPWKPEWYTRAHRSPALGGEELLSWMDGAGVDKAVLVQPSWAGDDNSTAVLAAQEHPDRFVVMARLGTDRRSAEAELERIAGCPVVVGVRLTFHRPEMQEHLVDGSTDWLWPALAGRGLPAMVYAPGRNRELARIARQHPGLRLAVDALGFTLAMKDDELDRPIRELDELVDVPNVALKATALPAYVTGDYPFRRLAPLVRRVVDTFGPERVMWASDATRVRAPYRDIVTFPGALDVLTDDELAGFMGGNLARWLQPEPARPHERT